MKPLAKKLKFLLKKNDISAHALEKMAGLKQSAVHNILQGKSKNPTIGTLKAISEILNCKVDELIEQPSSNPNQTNEWHGELYEKALQLANQLFRKNHIQPTREQAIHFIDEVYFYTLKSKSKNVDEKFAEWLITKYWV